MDTGTLSQGQTKKLIVTDPALGDLDVNYRFTVTPDGIVSATGDGLTPAHLAVTGVAPGEAVLTATTDTNSGQITITVTPEPLHLVLA